MIKHAEKAEKLATELVNNSEKLISYIKKRTKKTTVSADELKNWKAWLQIV